MEAFELRLWDGRLGRWLTVDPKHEFHSPYVGMGNNPINLIDPDGGATDDPPTEAGTKFGQEYLDPDTGVTYVWDEKKWSISSFYLKEVEVTGKNDRYTLADFKWDAYIFATRAERWADGWGKDAGEFIVSFHPGIALGNAYSGYTTGEDLFGNQMSKTGVAMEAASVIPIFKVTKIGKVVTPVGKIVTPLKKILPSWKKIAIDTEHIISGHMKGGSRVSNLKTIFPESMSEQQIINTVKDAYRNVHTKLKTQGDRVLVRGTSNGIEIEMWVNKVTKTIETAYPIY